MSYDKDSEIARLEQEKDELQFSNDLHSGAISRAVDRWHDAGGDKNTLPDVACLVEWLLVQWARTKDERNTLRAKCERLERELSRAFDAVVKAGTRAEAAEAKCERVRDYCKRRSFSHTEPEGTMTVVNVHNLLAALADDGGGDA